MVTRTLRAHAASLAHGVMLCNADLDRLNTACPAEPYREARAAEPKRQPIVCRSLHGRWRWILGLRIGGLTLALSGRTPAVGARRERTIYPGARGAHVTTHHGPLERVVRQQAIELVDLTTEDEQSRQVARQPRPGATGSWVPTTARRALPQAPVRHPAIHRVSPEVSVLRPQRVRRD